MTSAPARTTASLVSVSLHRPLAVGGRQPGGPKGVGERAEWDTRERVDAADSLGLRGGLGSPVISTAQLSRCRYRGRQYSAPGQRHREQVDGRSPSLLNTRVGTVSAFGGAQVGAKWRA